MRTPGFAADRATLGRRTCARVRAWEDVRVRRMHSPRMTSSDAPGCEWLSAAFTSSRSFMKSGPTVMRMRCRTSGAGPGAAGAGAAGAAGVGALDAKRSVCAGRFAGGGGTGNGRMRSRVAFVTAAG